jgi:molybdopterin-guanine dinucleotide biosynthesis protein A
VPHAPELTIVILAGGLATRLPGKLMLPIAGEPMLLRLRRRLHSDSMPCVVSTRAPLEAELAEKLACPIIVDSHPGSGPLGALATAAETVTTPLLAAVAADLPNMNAGLIARLVDAYQERARGGRLTDAVIPVWPDGTMEPLAALYVRTRLLQGARDALARGDRKVTAALAGHNVASYLIHDVDAALFANVNTPEEYAKIEAHER